MVRTYEARRYVRKTTRVSVPILIGLQTYGKGERALGSVGVWITRRNKDHEQGSQPALANGGQARLSGVANRGKNHVNDLDKRRAASSAQNACRCT
jgi:hypothetical protein